MQRGKNRWAESWKTDSPKSQSCGWGSNSVYYGGNDSLKVSFEPEAEEQKTDDESGDDKKWWTGIVWIEMNVKAIN